MHTPELRHALVPLLIFLLAVAALSIPGSAAEEDLAKKCGDESTKLSECLPYATAKTDSPSDKCCETASGIRQRAPVCLCYIIQQAQKTSGTVGIALQYTRILKLPDLCHIANANASLCPILLNIPPGSPDLAIFNGSALPSSNFTASSSAGRMHFGSVMVAMATAVVSSLF